MLEMLRPLWSGQNRQGGCDPEGDWFWREVLENLVEDFTRECPKGWRHRIDKRCHVATGIVGDDLVSIIFQNPVSFHEPHPVIVFRAVRALPRRRGFMRVHDARRRLRPEISKRKQKKKKKKKENDG